MRQKESAIGAAISSTSQVCVDDYSMYNFHEAKYNHRVSNLPLTSHLIDDDFARSFPSGNPHEGLETLFQRLQRKCLFVRPQAISIIDSMREAQKPIEVNSQSSEENTVNDDLVIVDAKGGQVGVGKSAVLTHVVHWARSHGWLTLFLPSARDLVEGGLWVQPSPYADNSFDQPQVAQLILHEFEKAHGSMLAKLQIQSTVSTLVSYQLPSYFSMLLLGN